MPKLYWRINDGRVWDAIEGAFVPSPGEDLIIYLSGADGGAATMG